MPLGVIYMKKYAEETPLTTPIQVNQYKGLSPREFLKGFMDIHVHTSPDIRSRILNDYEASLEAKEVGMQAIVLKSHTEPTAGRAQLAQKLTGFQVFGGVTLNLSMGGLNSEAVKNMALMGGKVVWLPTINNNEIELDLDKLEEILQIVKEYGLVLATGHLNPDQIFQVLDQANSVNIKGLIINHPLSSVVGASLDEQKEMSRHAYLEHCWVTTMPQHDGLNPARIYDAIMEVGAKRCVIATDFGQIHNPTPVVGMKMMVENLLQQGISWRDIDIMCRKNPEKIFF
jgi:Family of unknown function (DUF6282)